MWAAICATHTVIKTWINREGKGALVKLQVKPHQMFGLYWDLRWLLVYRTPTRLDLPFKCPENNKLCLSGYTLLLFTTSLSFFKKKKKITRLWIMTKLVKYSWEQLFSQSSCMKFKKKEEEEKKKGIHGDSQRRRTVATYELLKWKCPWNSEQHSHRHHLHINADGAGKKEDWTGEIMKRECSCRLLPKLHYAGHFYQGGEKVGLQHI